MDSSISHDPFAADATTPPEFRSARWARAGATDEEVAKLAESFDAMPLAAQAGEVQAIDTISDNELAEALDRMRQSQDFADFRATPAPEPELDEDASEGEAAADPAGDAGDAGKTGDGATGQDGGQPTGEAASTPSIDEQHEQEAARGPWNPAEQPLSVGDESYPLWNLEHGYVGTLIGDEVDGIHLVRPDVDTLAAAVTELLAAQKPPAG